VAPAAIVMGLHGGSERTPLTLLGPAIGLGGLMWMAALHQMRHPLAVEALRLASQRLSWIRPLR
jgi:hypothetical protein